MVIQLSLCAESRKTHDDRITFGAEWSYIASLHCNIHHNFYAEEGYRVNLRYSNFRYMSNGEISVFADMISGLIGTYLCMLDMLAYMISAKLFQYLSE